MSDWREGIMQRHLVGASEKGCLVGGERIRDVWLERGGSWGLVCGGIRRGRGIRGVRMYVGGCMWGGDQVHAEEWGGVASSA